MTELIKKENGASKIIKFAKLFFQAVLLIGGIAGTGILIGVMHYLTSQYHIAYLFWFGLLVLGAGYFFYKHKNFFTKNNFKSSLIKSALAGKKLLKFFLYSILIIIGIWIIFLIGGWIISGLTASSIIIILLIFILLK